MDLSLGRVAAHLIDRSEEKISNRIIELINSNINPPEPVTAGDVYVRAMYVVSDEVNSFGGRFPADELERLRELIIDSPVLVGHRKDKLPVARNFHAIVTEKDNRRWIKCYFYWLRSGEGAESLKENIDGGVYKESSIGFTFLFPECSVCGKDIRGCEHQPLVEYDLRSEEEADKSTKCHFNYRKIERVLETSLVYRGAVRNTTMTRELSVPEPIIIDSLDQLNADTVYLAVPYYDGLPVHVNVEQNRIQVRDVNGKELGDKVNQCFDSLEPDQFNECCGQLIGFRGKERCNLESLIRYLAGQSSPVTRLELKLIPDQDSGEPISVTNGAGKVSTIRHALTDKKSLPNHLRRLATRDGIRIWAADQRPGKDRGYWLKDIDLVDPSVDSWRIRFDSSRKAELALKTNNHLQTFLIYQFDRARFYRGARFVADTIEQSQIRNTNNSTQLSGSIGRYESSDSAVVAELTGRINGTLVLLPIKLSGENRYLVYLRQTD